MSRNSFIARAGLVILAAAGLVLWLQPPLTPFVPLPSPNGYDDFRKAGQFYVEPSLADHNYWELDHERLRAVVLPNANALKLARVGLSRECRVPLEYSEAYWDNVSLDLKPVRQLTFALRTEELLAVMEQRTNDAVISCLDSIRLSRAASCGGLMLHFMQGQHLERQGVAGLQRLTTSLDASTCREVVKTLELLESKRELAEDVLSREKAWRRQSLGLKRRIQIMIEAKSFDPTSSYHVAFVNDAKDMQRQTGLLLIDLAARAFELEKGRRAQSAKELVPDYISAIPKDPTTGAGLALPRQ